VAIELEHEGLAEAHDLAVRLALGIEVRAALCTAHRKRRERVLEDLLEAQELQDREVHGRMQADAALVGPDGRVELDAIAAVDLDLALVVHPGNTEHDDTLRLYQALEQSLLLILGMGIKCRLEGEEHLAGRLDEFRLVCIARLEILYHTFRVVHELPSYAVRYRESAAESSNRKALKSR
jgi:hypothetical protein